MAWTDAARRAASLARKRRALLTYKPSTQRKQQIAASSEKHITRILSAERTRNNAAMDTILKTNRRLHGIEVKTLIDNKNDKITMHPESRARKVHWAAVHNAVLHTVVVDARGKRRQIFYRAGVGSFRLAALQPVTSSQLRSIIR